MITVSEKALNHILNLMVDSGITPDTHNLRVGVKGGGCSGLSYVMDFDDKIEKLQKELYESNKKCQVLEYLLEQKNKQTEKFNFLFK
jgi:iron-sulfur cluster assembly protein